MANNENKEESSDNADLIVINYKGEEYTASKDILLKDIKGKDDWPDIIKHQMATECGFKRFDFGITDEMLKEFKEEKKKEKKKSKGKAIEAKPVTEEKKIAKPLEESISEDIDESILWKGINFIEQDKLESALECFEVFSEEYPEHHLGYYYTGYTNYLQNKMDQALEMLEKANEKNKSFIPSVFYQGRIEFDKGNFEEALEIFDTINDQFSKEDFLEHQLNLPFFYAICLHQLGRFERADEYFLFAYNLAPNDPNVLYYKGFNELSLQRYDYAVDTFKQLLSLDIHNEAFWNLFKGYSYYYIKENQ
jgi:tetratricopeptide (TPR) repeat protein